ncbi:MAG: DUF4465 domain-containing protein [Flavobacteriales bacterium]|nr:DUF4465 domain-containing protein [Flavobacteriales bacterium]
MKKGFLTLAFGLAITLSNAQYVSNFEGYLSTRDTFWNGSKGEGGIKSGGSFFLNNYNNSWGSWSGFSVSSMTDTVAGTWANQYASISGMGAHQSVSYGVVYNSGEIVLAKSATMDTVFGVMVNNSTYAYKTIKNGDAFAKKFGGTNGTDLDSFVVVFEGFDSLGASKGEVAFYLADYRFPNSQNDYIIKDWTWVDLSQLGAISKISLNFYSSDVGKFGMNTPAYMCLDSLVKNTPNTQFAPIANDDHLYVPSNSTDNILDLTSNDLDPDTSQPNFTLSIITNARFGYAVVDTSGKMTYTPNFGFNNLDSINYRICDQQGLCDEGLALVMVNSTPSAYGETDSVLVGATSILNLALNEVDEDKNNLFYRMIDSFKVKSFTITREGLLTYLAPSVFTVDSAVYQVCDKFGKCNRASVTIHTVEEFLSVDEKNTLPGAWKPFPNPTSGVIYFPTSELVDVRVIDISGKVFEFEKQMKQIDLSDFPEGMYLLEVSNDSGRHYSKILKTSN